MQTGAAMGTFTVVFERDIDGGYVVHVPSLPGCHTQGDTFEDAQKNAQEAIEAYLLVMKDDAQEIYVPTESIVAHVLAPLPV